MTTAPFTLITLAAPKVRPWREGDIYYYTVGPNRSARARDGIQPRQRSLMAVVVRANGSGALLFDEEGDLLHVDDRSRDRLRFVSSLRAWRRRRVSGAAKSRGHRPRAGVAYYFDGVDRGSWGGFVATMGGAA